MKTYTYKFKKGTAVISRGGRFWWVDMAMNQSSKHIPGTTPFKTRKDAKLFARKILDL